MSAFLKHLLERDYPMGNADHAVSETLVFPIRKERVSKCITTPPSEWTWNHGDRSVEVRGFWPKAMRPEPVCRKMP